MLAIVALIVVGTLAITLGWAAWLIACWRTPTWRRGEWTSPEPVTLELRAAAAPALIRRSARPAVVLVHGILGFDSFGLGPLRIDYFRRVAARLGAAGYQVTTARLPAIAGVPERAAALSELLATLPDDRLTLIAHSMGGLDARWAMRDPAVAARIASLITIGTPHGGTPVADLLARGPLDRARALATRLGLPCDGLDWLTTWRAAAFRREVGEPAGVRCASLVTATGDRARVHPLLRITHAYLARCAGPSDGLVPASSQRFGEVLDEIEIDHWGQVGWSGRHDASALLLGALARLDVLPSADHRALPAASAA